MRLLLLSAAALTLMAGTVTAQPEHGHGHRPENAGPPGPQMQRGGGPQIQQGSRSPMQQGGRPQGQMQGRMEGRMGGGPRPGQVAQGGGGPTNFTNQLQGRQPDERGRPQGRGGPRDQNRGNWQNNHANFDNRGSWSRGGFGTGGPRRDWRSYSNYHRDWRPTQRFRVPAYRRPAGWYARRWTFGDILPALFWTRDYWLDYRLYSLPPPPFGAVWVRVGDDALLIDQDSGEIITVSYGVFY